MKYQGNSLKLSILSKNNEEIWLVMLNLKKIRRVRTGNNFNKPFTKKYSTPS